MISIHISDLTINGTAYAYHICHPTLRMSTSSDSGAVVCRIDFQVVDNHTDLEEGGREAVAKK